MQPTKVFGRGAAAPVVSPGRSSGRRIVANGRAVADVMSPTTTTPPTTRRTAARAIEEAGHRLKDAVDGAIDMARTLDAGGREPRKTDAAEIVADLRKALGEADRAREDLLAATADYEAALAEADRDELRAATAEYEAARAARLAEAAAWAARRAEDRSPR